MVLLALQIRSLSTYDVLRDFDFRKNGFLANLLVKKIIYGLDFESSLLLVIISWLFNKLLHKSVSVI